MPFPQLRNRYQFDKFFQGIKFHDENGKEIEWELSVDDLRYWSTYILKNGNDKIAEKLLSDGGLGWFNPRNVFTKDRKKYDGHNIYAWSQKSNRMHFYFRFKDRKAHKISNIVFKFKSEFMYNHEDVKSFGKNPYQIFMNNLELNLYSGKNVYKLDGTASSSDRQLTGSNITIGNSILSYWRKTSLSQEVKVNVFNVNNDDPNDGVNNVKNIKNMNYEIYDANQKKWIPSYNYSFLLANVDNIHIRYSRKDGGIFTSSLSKYKFYSLNIRDMMIQPFELNKINIRSINADLTKVKWEGGSGFATFTMSGIKNPNPQIISNYYELVRTINGEKIVANSSTPPINIKNGDVIYLVFSVKNGYFVNKKNQEIAKVIKYKIPLPVLNSSKNIDIDEILKNENFVSILNNMNFHPQGKNGQAKINKAWVADLKRIVMLLKNLSNNYLNIRIEAVSKMGINYLDVDSIENYPLFNSLKLKMIISQYDSESQIVSNGKYYSNFTVISNTVSGLVSPKIMPRPSINIKNYINGSTFDSVAFENFVNVNNLVVKVLAISSATGHANYLSTIPRRLLFSTKYVFKIIPKEGYAFGSQQENVDVALPNYVITKQSLQLTHTTQKHNINTKIENEFINFDKAILPSTSDFKRYYWPIGELDLKDTNVFNIISLQGYKINILVNGSLAAIKDDAHSSWTDGVGNFIKNLKFNNSDSIEIRLYLSQGKKWSDLSKLPTDFISKKYTISILDFSNQENKSLSFLSTFHYHFQGYNGNAYFTNIDGDQSQKHNLVNYNQRLFSSGKIYYYYLPFKYLPSSIDLFNPNGNELQKYRISGQNPLDFKVENEGRIIILYKKDNNQLLWNFSHYIMRAYDVENLKDFEEPPLINVLENIGIDTQIINMNRQTKLDQSLLLNSGVIIPKYIKTSQFALNKNDNLWKWFNDENNELSIFVNNKKVDINKDIKLNENDKVRISLFRNKETIWWSIDPMVSKFDVISYEFTVPRFPRDILFLPIDTQDQFIINDQNITINTSGVIGESVDVNINLNNNVFLPWTNKSNGSWDWLFNIKVMIYDKDNNKFGEQIITLDSNVYHKLPTISKQITLKNGKIIYFSSLDGGIVLNAQFDNVPDDAYLKIAYVTKKNIMIDLNNDNNTNIYLNPVKHKITGILKSFWSYYPKPSQAIISGTSGFANLSNNISSIDPNEAIIKIYQGSDESGTLIWSNDVNSNFLDINLNILNGSNIHVVVVPNHNKYIIDKTKYNDINTDIYSETIRINNLIPVIDIHNLKAGLDQISKKLVIQHGSGFNFIKASQDLLDFIEQISLSQKDWDKIQLYFSLQTKDISYQISINDLRDGVYLYVDKVREEISSSDNAYKINLNNVSIDMIVKLKPEATNYYNLVNIDTNNSLLLNKHYIFEITNEDLQSIVIKDYISEDYFEQISTINNYSTISNFKFLVTYLNNGFSYDLIRNLFQSGKMVVVVTVIDSTGKEVSQTLTEFSAEGSIVDQINKWKMYINAGEEKDSGNHYILFDLGAVSLSSVESIKVSFNLLDSNNKFVKTNTLTYTVDSKLELKNDTSSYDEINTDGLVDGYLYNDSVNKENPFDLLNSFEHNLVFNTNFYNKYNKLITWILGGKEDVNGKYFYKYIFNVVITSPSGSQTNIWDIFNISDLDTQTKHFADSEINLQTIINILNNDENYKSLLVNGATINIFAEINGSFSGNLVFDYRDKTKDNISKDIFASKKRLVISFTLKDLTTTITLDPASVASLENGVFSGRVGNAEIDNLENLISMFKQYQIKVFSNNGKLLKTFTDNTYKKWMAEKLINGMKIEVTVHTKDNEKILYGSSKLDSLIITIDSIYGINEVVQFNGFYSINKNNQYASLLTFVYDKNGEIIETVDFLKIFNITQDQLSWLFDRIDFKIEHYRSGTLLRTYQYNSSALSDIMTGIALGDNFKIKITSHIGYIFSNGSSYIESKDIFVTQDKIAEDVVDINMDDNIIDFESLPVLDGEDISNFGHGTISERWKISNFSKIIFNSNGQDWTAFISRLNNNNIDVTIYVYNKNRTRVIDTYTNALPSGAENNTWIDFKFTVRHGFKKTKVISLNNGKSTSEASYSIYIENLHQSRSLDIPDQLSLIDPNGINGEGKLDVLWFDSRNFDIKYFVKEIGSNNAVEYLSPPDNLKNNYEIWVIIYAKNQIINISRDGKKYFMKKITSRHLKINNLINVVEFTMPDHININIDSDKKPVFNSNLSSPNFNVIVDILDSNDNILQSKNISEISIEELTSKNAHNLRIKVRLIPKNYYFNANNRTKEIFRVYSLKNKIVDVQEYIPTFHDLIEYEKDGVKYFDIGDNWLVPEYKLFTIRYSTSDSNYTGSVPPKNNPETRTINMMFSAKSGYAIIFSKKDAIIKRVSSDRIINSKNVSNIFISNIYGDLKQSIIAIKNLDAKAKMYDVYIDVYDQQEKFVKSIKVSNFLTSAYNIQNSQLLKLSLRAREGFYFEDYSTSKLLSLKVVKNLSSVSNIASNKTLIISLTTIFGISLLSLGFILIRRRKYAKI